MRLCLLDHKRSCLSLQLVYFMPQRVNSTGEIGGIVTARQKVGHVLLKHRRKLRVYPLHLVFAYGVVSITVGTATHFPNGLTAIGDMSIEDEILPTSDFLERRNSISLESD